MTRRNLRLLVNAAVLAAVSLVYAAQPTSARVAGTICIVCVDDCYGPWEPYPWEACSNFCWDLSRPIGCDFTEHCGTGAGATLFCTDEDW